MAENTERFVSISEASAVSGASRRTIGRWLDEGTEVRTATGARGTRTVHLGDVIAKQKRVTIEPEDEDDDDAPALTPEVAHARMFGELTRAIAIQNRHIEQMHAPAAKLVEQFSAENDKLRTRITELEKQITEMHATHERHLSEEYTRNREEQRERRAAERQERALQTLMRFAPAVVAGVAGHFGAKGAQEAVLVDMVVRLTDEQFRALVVSGFLGPEAVSVLERIRATNKQHAAASQNPNGSPPGNAAPNSPESRAA